jgi:hypothetical protein
MVTIIERTYGDGTDKRLKLVAQEAIRPMSIGSDWTTIIIGIRYNITDLGANMTGTPRLTLGVCHGTAHGYQSVTTANWVGMRTGLGTWTRNAGGYYSHGGTGTFDLRTKVGNTITGGGQTNTTTVYTLWDLEKRGMLGVRLTKVTSTTMSASALFASSTTTSVYDVSEQTLLSAMESTTSATTGYTWSAINSGAASTAFDEDANGALNCVSIAWSRSDTDLEISDVVVARML